MSLNREGDGEEDLKDFLGLKREGGGSREKSEIEAKGGKISKEAGGQWSRSP